jgi:cell division protein ZapA
MQAENVTVRILDKEFHIACPTGKDAGLRAAAHFLDLQMQEIRRAGRVIGTERIAMMAALNIANELLQSRKNKDSYIDSFTSRLQILQDKIDSAIDGTLEKNLA